MPIFLDSMKKVYLFLENSREDIKFIAQHSAYPLIVKVYFGVNFPIASYVKEVDTWQYFVGEKKISSIELWTLLVTMSTCCRVPMKEEFFIYYFQLSHNSHDIYEKNQKKELTVQKIKLNNDNALSLPSLNMDTLNDFKSKKKLGNGDKGNDICSKKSKEKIGKLLTFLNTKTHRKYSPSY